jgi:two-component system response regulator MtrA
MQKKIKIALVEDDENLRFLVSHRLTEEGYHIFEAADGNDAEELILAEQPDIVLLDWMLPGKQGIDVCASLREKALINSLS